MAGEQYRLVIGNKNTSSWSLRPWIAMRRFAIPFVEININLRAPDKKEQILRHSPSGKIPALYAGGLMVWDSLAVLEYLADSHPDMAIWPKSSSARAIARSVSAEMHSGFQALREHCPMDFLGRAPMPDPLDAVKTDVSRIVALWCDSRARFGGSGPFLFGEFSAADAMYAPVVSRFRTYIPDLKPYGDGGTASAYIEAMFSTPEMKAWQDGARAEVTAV